MSAFKPKSIAASVMKGGGSQHSSSGGFFERKNYYLLWYWWWLVHRFWPRLQAPSMLDWTSIFAINIS